MLRILIIIVICFNALLVTAQPNKKPAKQPTGSQPDMNKLLEEALEKEGMSEQEKEEMRKLMKGVMPELEKTNATTADYPEFTRNSELIPKKDPAKIAALSKKALTKTEVAGYANGLYAKMMVKGDPAEMAIVKKVVAMTPNANDIGGAAILAMLQGHPQAAMALSIKAVANDPADLNWQNNMGALLTSYGYPEQAMPVLKKLRKEIPWNSTVLNNIGQAWLSAGEVDSANRYFQAAVRFNPQHHEARTGKGLVEEAKGDHEKAAQSYEEAMHSSVNPFIEQVLKNNKGQKATGNLDFEKIKRNLAIYEYFPKGWMPEVPVLHNNVKYYNEDYGMIKGYQEMIRQLGDKINDMTRTLGGELDKLTQTQDNEKDNEKKFVNEMMKSSMKGLSWMSKPAVVVMGVLSAYTTKWHMDYMDTLKKISEWANQLDVKRQKDVEAIYKHIRDQRGTTCEQYKGQLDKLENDYMQQVNPRLRDLVVKKTEEFRQWLNAWCTWSWYVTGNTKNIIVMQDLNFTQYLAEMYTKIITSMEVKMEHCNPPVKEVKEVIYPPEIPNFVCPAVVSIPAGAEWEDLVAGAKDFDANKYLIKKTDKPLPNTSVAYGTNGMVAEPGKSSFIKTANGSISPGVVDNSGDAKNPTSLYDEYKQLMKEFGDDAVKGLRTGNEKDAGQDAGMDWVKKEFYRMLDDFTKGTLPIEKMETIDDLRDLYHQLAARRNTNQVNKLMKQMMSTGCEGGNKKAKDRLNEELKRIAENRHQEAKDLINKADAEEMESEAIQAEIAAKLRAELDQLLKKIDANEHWADGDLDRMITLFDALRSYRDNYKEKFGVVPTVCTGFQAPSTFTPNKTLFQ